MVHMRNSGSGTTEQAMESIPISPRKKNTEVD
jgi:hypothetical protein